MEPMKKWQLLRWEPGIEWKPREKLDRMIL